MDKQYGKSLEGLKKILRFTQSNIQKRYQIGKHMAKMAYVDTALKFHFHQRHTGYRNE